VGFGSQALQARERRSREAGCTAAEGRASEGRTPGWQCPVGLRLGCGRCAEGSTLRSRTRRRRAARNGMGGLISETGSDLRTAQSHEGESSGVLSGRNKPGRLKGWPIAARSAESVETLRAGSGGTWQPRLRGTFRLQALKSKATFRRVAGLSRDPLRCEPGGGSSEVRRGGFESRP
jgi:hypothetical protein